MAIVKREVFCYLSIEIYDSLWDVGCWMSDVGCWMLQVGCWMLDVGCWMLQVGSNHHNNKNGSISPLLRIERK
jgi:hypothetical protein